MLHHITVKKMAVHRKEWKNGEKKGGEKRKGYMRNKYLTNYSSLL
jgi:hypothetical protein